jgi:hypothetical protein
MNEKITLTPEQLEAWRNDKARKDFIYSHHNWPRLGGTPEIGVSWHCLELPDGRRVVAMTQPHKYGVGGYALRLCWWNKGEKYPNVMCMASVSEISDYLKDLKARALKDRKA